jgi:hypothetical protein
MSSKVTVLLRRRDDGDVRFEFLSVYMDSGIELCGVCGVDTSTQSWLWHVHTAVSGQ